ncbi:MAG TPA: hypothetical protein PKJ86_01735 [Candidatus Dojkabacteria bacterium]|nr:hypothetical protein [Candidatus Dojkabacteria bacterium]HQG57725.1 hypothetical protein [Candidatus Dojkabacteria bacterium]
MANNEKKLEVLDVIPILVENLKKISAINLIVHPANFNWRQKNTLNTDQLRTLDSGLIQYKRPMIEIPRYEVLTNYRKVVNEIVEDYKNIIPNTLVSFCSKVITGKRKEMHLPTMNYHPILDGITDEEELKNSIIKLLKLIVRWDGYLLKTDRYWHYYGEYLLSQEEFYHWLGLHSNSCFSVSPRYIGQSLRDGYTPTRQTSTALYKMTIPYVSEKIQKNAENISVWDYQEIEIIDFRKFKYNAVVHGYEVKE